MSLIFSESFLYFVLSDRPNECRNWDFCQPRSQGHLRFQNGGRRKALASAGHVTLFTPQNPGCNKLATPFEKTRFANKNQNKMAATTQEKLPVLCRLGLALNRCNFRSFCFKPLEVKCFEYLLEDQDVVAVLPTGFGKLLLF